MYDSLNGLMLESDYLCSAMCARTAAGLSHGFRVRHSMHDWGRALLFALQLLFLAMPAIAQEPLNTNTNG